MNYDKCMKKECKICHNYDRCFKKETKKKINRYKNKEEKKMKIKFLVDVPDKYTREEYKKGQVKEFEDSRAKEILAAKQSNGQPYVEEVIEKKVETATKKVKKETAVKKTTKKAK